MPDELNDEIQAAITTVRSIRDRISNVHSTYDSLGFALVYLEEAAEPCACEHCLET